MNVTRFAPSPTGYLHLGHAASALHVWQAAKTLKARVNLRIENIDHTRCRPEYEDAIMEDLSWLGLVWDPPVRRQSEHLAAYETALSKLREDQLVYRCFKTRAELQTGTASGRLYFGAPLSEAEERSRLERGDAFAWRLSIARAKAKLGTRYEHLSFQEFTRSGVLSRSVNPAREGDVVLARKDIGTSYHLACCHDDAVQGTTHIIRGEDLRTVTDIHVLLQALMGWPEPIYQFHPLIMGPDNKKLSKRNSDKSLCAYRKEGVTPDDIRRMTGFE